MLIKILIIIVCSWILSIVAEIGNYPQLNPNKCGYSRHSSEVSDCFEWHKKFATDPIVNGRNATAGEAPWLVHIMMRTTEVNQSNPADSLWRYYYCSGSIIADQWVVTAAHCFVATPYPGNTVQDAIYLIMSGVNASRYIMLELMENYQTFDYNLLGTMHITLYNVEDYIIHHNYSTVNATFYRNGSALKYNELALHDIALVKLSGKIDSSDNGDGYPLVNSICVPNEDFVEYNNSYAMIAGYGDTGTDQTRARDDRDRMPLQLTYVKTVYMSNMSIFIFFKTIPTGGTICAGDSGGPIWQSFMGRAVIIGIETQGLIDECKHQDSSVGIAVRLSDYIDWIISTTGLDLDHLRLTGHSPHNRDVNGHLEQPIKIYLD